MDGALTREQAVDTYRSVDTLMRGDLGHYCGKLVFIKNKLTGVVELHRWNRAQIELDRAIQDQWDRRGLVRIIILKARQLGISTYVCERYYRKTSLWPGQSTYILTHEDPATQTLFGMSKLIHDNMDPEFRPVATSSNANELRFGAMDSGYRVGTAKNVKGAGRSQNIQNFHGSEVAFWAQAEQHFAGVMQAVPLASGTEIILESTANGVGGIFYEQWGLAERGQSDFECIFLPWYWAEEYRREPDEDDDISLEETEYGDLYDLDDAQIAWMHFKNIELGGEPGDLCNMFRQEYPATAAEAFQVSGTDSWIPGEMVMRGRRWTCPDDQSYLPRILGVDTARGGGDLTRFIDRQGRVAGSVINETHNDDDETIIADRIALILNRHPDIAMVFIDITGGYGGGVHDILRSEAMGFANRVRGVKFGSTTQVTEPKKYRRKRDEIWGRMKEWFKDPGGADIPDDDVLHRHISGPGFRYDANDRFILEPKEKIKARLGFSPDGGDALALTFSFTVHKPKPPGEASWREDLQEEQERDWMTG